MRDRRPALAFLAICLFYGLTHLAVAIFQPLTGVH